MRRQSALFQRVVRLRLVLGVVLQAELVRLITKHRRHDVGRVLHSVDVADLVSVVRRYRKLFDAQACCMELDDDLGVEVEVVGVAVEGDLLERLGGVQPVAGVELAQVGAEHGVFKARQNLVSDILVERHAALPSSTLRHHARPEDRVRFAALEWREELAEGLGGVLAIAVQKRDDVVALLDRILVAADLVAAVAEVFLVAEDAQLGFAVQVLVAEADEIGVVLARVVEDEDLVDAIPDVFGDAIEDLAQRLHRVVGDDENRDLFARLRLDDGEFFGGRPADRIGHTKQWYLARMGLAI